MINNFILIKIYIYMSILRSFLGLSGIVDVFFAVLTIINELLKKNRISFYVLISIVITFVCYSSINLFSLAVIQSFALALITIIGGICFYINLARGQNIQGYGIVYHVVLLFLLLQLALRLLGHPEILEAFVIPDEATSRSHFDLQIELFSSIFPSSKFLARFIFVLWLIDFVNCRNRVTINFVVFVIIALSGTRDVLFLFLLLLIYQSVLKIDLAKLVILSIPLAFILFVGVSKNMIYLSYFLPNVDETIIRLSMFFPVFYWDSPVFYGFGAGTFGQEARLSGSLYDFTEQYVAQNFSNLDFFGNAYNWNDSGFTKILVEYGLVGLVLFSLLVLVGLSSTMVMYCKYRHQYFIRSAIAAVVMLVIFLKTHAFFSHVIFLGIFLYFLYPEAKYENNSRN